MIQSTKRVGIIPLVGNRRDTSVPPLLNYLQKGTNIGHFGARVDEIIKIRKFFEEKGLGGH